MGDAVFSAAINIGQSLASDFIQRSVLNLFAPDREVGGRLETLAIQTSTEGAPIPVVYGRARLTGQVIWAARFRETVVEDKAGGKGGGPTVRDYRYSVSFAVGLCEGPIDAVGRIWANGAEMDLSQVTMRVYLGDDDQPPDPLISALEGAGRAPAQRGLAYVVFEDLPLENYGDRLPNLSFEVFNAPLEAGPRLESLTQGVCLIPASGEFAYATEPVAAVLGPGAERAENVHTTRADANLLASLNALEAALPNVRSVALVTAWFGDDLRCDRCRLRPGVELSEKLTRPLTWRAGGKDRASGYLVSSQDGRPNYGGTPSDETIIAAIRELKARGYAVTLYPFILMDIPRGIGKLDPYGGPEQQAFPWRGRITSDPAPGRPGSPDQSAVAASKVDAFFGAATASDFQIGDGEVHYSGPDEDSFRRFILHHAALAAAAGGVEAFTIGSEIRALTSIRSGAGSYPAVERFRALAGEARAILGSDVKLTYAADWSEYFGHDPADGSGDRYFHLDPLWADPEIDFVGIDWYAPLSDWRDGDAHLDAAGGAGSIYDRAYLAGNVEGGEGYDWYYASEQDRVSQTRTPITDGAYGEPWVFRYKDLRAWWSSPHYDRPGGVKAGAPTAWIPQSKPIRLVELGCPAVDKGANQPNVFLDPKSAESARPYFSSGARDDLIRGAMWRHCLITGAPRRAAIRSPRSMAGRCSISRARMFGPGTRARFRNFPPGTMFGPMRPIGGGAIG